MNAADEYLHISQIKEKIKLKTLQYRKIKFIKIIYYSRNKILTNKLWKLIKQSYYVLNFCIKCSLFNVGNFI